MRKEMQMFQKRQEEEIERQKEMIREMRPGTKKTLIELYYFVFRFI